MLSISIIIPNYNGEENLKTNLKSVVSLLNNKSFKEIIIIDDCSLDNSVNYIKDNYPMIKIIEKKVNSGFSETVNIGVNKAQSDLVFLLNTDTKPESNILNKILPYFNNPKTFAVGCLDKSKEDNKIVERGRGIGKFMGGFLVHQRGNINKNNTLWVSAGSGVFRKNIWIKLGGMDLLYSPFYWEDIDISYRALKSGYLIYFEKEAKVIHEHNKGSILTNYSQEKVNLISLRNQIIFVWKNISDLNYLIEHLFFMFLQILKSIFKFDMIFLQAFLLALAKLPVILYHRLEQSKYYVLKDKKILEQFEVNFKL